MFTVKFWRDAAERMITTAAESALLVLGAGQLDAINADWANVLGFAAGGAVLSLLKALAAGRLVGAVNSASLDPNPG